MSKLSDFAEHGEYRLASTTFEQVVERCWVHDSEFVLLSADASEQLLEDRAPNQTVRISAGGKKIILAGAVCTEVLPPTLDRESAEYAVKVSGIVLNVEDFRLVSRERDIEVEEKLASGGLVEMFPTGFYTERSRYSLNDKEDKSI